MSAKVFMQLLIDCATKDFRPTFYWVVYSIWVSIAFYLEKSTWALKKAFGKPCYSFLK